MRLTNRTRAVSAYYNRASQDAEPAGNSPDEYDRFNRTEIEK